MSIPVERSMERQEDTKTPEDASPAKALEQKCGLHLTALATQSSSLTNVLN